MEEQRTTYIALRVLDRRLSHIVMLSEAEASLRYSYLLYVE